jgi:hypothetical protein
MELKVAVYITPPFIIKKNRKEENKNEIYYTGLFYDIWNIIKVRLIKKKIIKGYKEVFFSKAEITPNDLHKKVVDGEYDLCIGPWSAVKKRISTQFTRPICLNKFSVAYFPEQKNYIIIAKAVYKGFLKPVLIGLVIITIISIIIYLTPIKFGIKDIWELISAIIFRSIVKYTQKGSIYNIAILILSLLFWVYLAGEMTSTLIETKKRMFDNKIHRDSIKGRVILTPKGYGNSIHWEKYGARIEEGDGNNMVDTYKKNMNKYYGFFDDIMYLKEYKFHNPDIIISTDNFGYDEICWCMNDDKKLSKILYNINNEIVSLQDEDLIHPLCVKYFDDDNYLCQL